MNEELNKRNLDEKVEDDTGSSTFSSIFSILNNSLNKSFKEIIDELDSLRKASESSPRQAEVGIVLIVVPLLFFDHDLAKDFKSTIGFLYLIAHFAIIAAGLYLIYWIFKLSKGRANDEKRKEILFTVVLFLIGLPFVISWSLNYFETEFTVYGLFFSIGFYAVAFSLLKSLLFMFKKK